MVIIKCGYAGCKHGGEVSKEEGVKIGSRWFHKECAREKELKQEIEKYWLTEINNGSVLQILRKAINDLVKIYDADYILWVIKECKPRRINLTYPMGMKKLCDDNKFKDEWNRKKLNKEVKQMKNEFENHIKVEDNSFVYIPSTKKFTDIL